MRAKLAFAHRILWKRDQTYRIAFVLGPPIMAGALLAALLWWVAPGLLGGGSTGAPWAIPEPSGNLPQDGTAVAEAPFAHLPPPGADGQYRGLEPGWRGSINKIELQSTVSTNLLNTSLARLSLPPGPLDIDRIIAAGPPLGLFAGVAEAILAVREGGRYQISMRLHRLSYQSADCLMRLALGRQRVLSQMNLDLEGESNIIFNPVNMDLQPGAYRVMMAFGCWHDGHMQGPGELILMLRRPGDPALSPIRMDEVWRPVLAK